MQSYSDNSNFNDVPENTGPVNQNQSIDPATGHEDYDNIEETNVVNSQDQNQILNSEDDDVDETDAENDYDENENDLEDEPGDYDALDDEEIESEQEKTDDYMVI